MESYQNGQLVASKPSAVQTATPTERIDDSSPDVVSAIKHQTFRDYFGSEKFSRADNDRIGFVIESLQQDGEGEEAVLNRIKRIDLQLGSEKIGQSKLIKIYNYVKMAKSIHQEILGGL